MNYIVNLEVAEALMEAGYNFGQDQSDIYQLNNIHFFLSEYGINAIGEYDGHFLSEIDEQGNNFYPIVYFNGQYLKFDNSVLVSKKEAFITAIEHAVEQFLEIAINHKKSVERKEQMINLKYKERVQKLTAEESEILKKLVLEFPIDKFINL